MAKTKATRKTINDQFSNVYATGYCGLWYLLKAYEASYYNSGIMGWNWDAHVVDSNTVIVTGYRNLTGKFIPYEISKKYNKLAEAVCKNSKFNWPEAKAELQKLMAQMLQELNNGKF